MRDFLHIRTEIAENNRHKRQFRVKSRIVPAEYDDTIGWGLIPAGLFAFLEEGYFACDDELGSDMHPLWTITINRLGLRGIVQSKKAITKPYRNMYLC